MGTASLQETNVEREGRSARRGQKLELTSLLDIVVALAVFVLAWQAVFWLRVYPPFLLPSPAMTLGSFIALCENGTLGLALYTTGYRLAAGFALSIVLGVALGLAMVTFKRFGRVMSSFGLGLQSFPSIAWVPFAILIVGLSDWGILFVVVLSSVFSVMLSTYSGIRNIPQIYVRAAKNMGSRRVSLFRHVMLPAAAPSLLTGLRQAWSFAWHALIGAEMLMASVGLGAILYYGSEFVRMDQVIASMFVIFSIGVVADRLLFLRLEMRARSRRGLSL